MSRYITRKEFNKLYNFFKEWTVDLELMKSTLKEYTSKLTDWDTLIHFMEDTEMCMRLKLVEGGTTDIMIMLERCWNVVESIREYLKECENDK